MMMIIKFQINNNYKKMKLIERLLKKFKKI